MERQQRFSIRKFKTAVGSALLATFLLGMPALQAVNVLAETQAQELTVQQNLKNATNLIDAQLLKSDLAKEFEAKAGTSTGELLHGVPSQELDEAAKKAQAAGVIVSHGETVKYDSLDAAQEDYAGQLENLATIIAKQEAATKAYQEAVTSYKLYQEAKAKYEADKSLHDIYLVAQADYDKAFEAYQVAFAAYEKELANNVKLLADYELAKAEYTKAYSLYQDKLAKYTDTTKANEAKKVAYESALEQYKKDYAAYEKALAAHRTATESDAAKEAEYQKALAQYNKENEQYQKDLVAYQKALAEAEKNTGRDGYLNEVTLTNILLMSEPDAQFNKIEVLNGQPKRLANNFAARATHNDETLTHLTTSSNLLPATVTSADEAVHLKFSLGDKIKVTYDNLQNSLYKGKPLSRIEMIYELDSSASSDLALVTLDKDPTGTLTISSPYSKVGSNGNTILKIKPSYYDYAGNKIEVTKENPIVYVFSSLNNRSDGGTHSVVEGMNVGNGRFVEYNGSSIQNHNGIAYSSLQNSYNNALIGLSFDGPADWDGAKNRNATYGAIAAVYTSNPEFSVHIQNKLLSDDITSSMWVSISNKLEESSVVAPKPVEPTKPTPPKSTVTGNEPQKPTPPVEPTYEKTEKPTPPVEPTKPLITEPQKPTEPTPPGIVPPPPGEPTPVPIPKEPEALSVTVHKATYAVAPKPTKGVTNEAGEDVSNGLIPKGSVVKFPISLPSLKAGRKPTENHVIHDYVDEGVEMNLEAIKAAYPGYDVTFSEEDRLLTLTATEAYVAEMNKDLSKDFDFVTPDLVGRVLNDGATYTNTIRWVWNDYDSFSETVKVSTPGKTPDPDHPTNNLIEPTKTVTNLEGQNIDGQAILATDQLVYPNLWDLDQFATIKNGDKAKQVHIYIEDIDGTKAIPDLENLTFIDKAKEEVKTPLKVTHVESLDKADKALKELIVAAGLDDDIQGDFVAIVPEDMAAFEELHVKTGNSISFDLKMTPKEGATGEIKNTSYQIAYGNGYKTKTTTNTIQVTTEWEDKTTKESLKNMVTGDKTEERGDFPHYRFVETVNTKTGIKHIFERLYTTEWEEEGTGRVLKDKVTDIDTKEKGEVDGMTFVKTIETETGIKHIFKKVPETPKETKTPTAKTPGNPSKGNLPSTGDSTSLLAYLGMGLLSILLAWKLGLGKKIKAIFSR